MGFKAEICSFRADSSDLVGGASSENEQFVDKTRLQHTLISEIWKFKSSLQNRLFLALVLNKLQIVITLEAKV